MNVDLQPFTGVVAEMLITTLNREDFSRDNRDALLDGDDTIFAIDDYFAKKWGIPARRSQ